MAGATEKDQKTELPTHKKLMDSAREGDVLMSKELATALMMLAGAGWLLAAGGWLVDSAGELVSLGMLAAMGLQVACYLVVWAGWWLSKR